MVKWQGNPEKGVLFVLSLLLFQEICQMFVALVLGWLIVRCGVLKSGDSKILSVIALYLIFPCVIINAFQIEYTSDRVQGMLLALGAAVLTHLIFFALTAALRKPLHLSPVEQASIIYSNAGNLTIPIVAAVLGSEWVLYVSMYILVQQLLLWSHCRFLLSGENQFSWKKALLNVNILSIFTGMALFFLRLPLPAFLKGAAASIGGMIGPISMMVAGMLIGNVDCKRLLQPGIWKVVLLRLVFFPLVVLLVLKHSGMAALVPDGSTLLLVSLLSSVTPSAAAVTQLAQVYSDEGEAAGLINVATTVLCLATIPVLCALYQL